MVLTRPQDAMTMWDLPNNTAGAATIIVLSLRGHLILHHITPRTTCTTLKLSHHDLLLKNLSVISPEVQNSQGYSSMEATIISDAGDQVRCGKQCGIQNETFGLEKNVIGEVRNLVKQTFWQSRLEAKCCGNFTFGGTVHSSDRLPWTFPMFQLSVSIIILIWTYWIWNSEIYETIGNLLLAFLDYSWQFIIYPLIFQISSFRHQYNPDSVPLPPTEGTVPMFNPAQVCEIYTCKMGWVG